MYREEILDHYRHPRNEGSLKNSREADMENPNCGDTCTFYLKVEDGEITKVRHRTEGCAISTASASILSQELQGMEENEVLDLDGEWMLEKLAIEVSPMRRKCVTLGLETAKRAINNEGA